MGSIRFLSLLIAITGLGGTSWGFPSGSPRNAWMILQGQRSLPTSSISLKGPSQSPPSSSAKKKNPTTSTLHVLREPDQMEMILGGVRYEMVPLPDRMCDTTVFVGNFCEFVHDEDLSQLFQSVSQLQSLPACVIRKINMQSLRYGFVTFLTVQEKEVRVHAFVSILPFGLLHVFNGIFVVFELSIFLLLSLKRRPF
jgi:hypothetical protein